MNAKFDDTMDFSPEETAPGVKVLKHLWNIPQKGSAREPAPEKVSTNIYDVPTSANIPRRAGRRR